MRVDVIHPDELDALLAAAWREMQRATPGLASPFLAPEFTQAVGRARPDARVALLWDAGSVGGFFPFHRRPLATGVPIGAGIADVEGVVHAPGFTWEPRALLGACGLDVWRFEHLHAGQTPFAPYHAAVAPSPAIALGEGYVEQRRRASERVAVALRKGRKLAREVGPVHFEYDVCDPQALRLLLGWKSAQYRRSGHADRFRRAWIVHVVEALFEQRAAGCRGTLSVLWAADEPVAAHFGLRSQRVLASWFPAYSTAASRYSPGWLLFLRLAEAAAADGLHEVALGKGDEPYKQSLKTHDAAVAEGRVQRPSIRALVRAIEGEPRRRARRFVLEHRALRLAARRTLREVGRLRER